MWLAVIGIGPTFISAMKNDCSIHSIPSVLFRSVLGFSTTLGNKEIHCKHLRSTLVTSRQITYLPKSGVGVLLSVIHRKILIFSCFCATYSTYLYSVFKRVHISLYLRFCHLFKKVHIYAIENGSH